MSSSFSALRTLIEDPSNNYAAVAVAIAVVVTFVLLLIMLLVAFALPPARRARGARAASGCGVFILAIAIVGVGLGVASLVWYRSTSESKYCASTCHEMSGAAASWSLSAHASVACVDCHERDQYRGALGNTYTRLRDIWAHAGGRGTVRRHVDQSTCVACHEQQLGAPLTARNGETFTHAQIVGNKPCRVCHGTQGHTPHEP